MYTVSIHTMKPTMGSDHAGERHPELLARFRAADPAAVTFGLKIKKIKNKTTVYYALQSNTDQKTCRDTLLFSPAL